MANGTADIAAIDNVTWQTALEHEPAAKEVSIVAHSSPRPGLPFITANRDADMVVSIRNAVENALDEYGQPLGIRTLVDIPPHAYETLLS